MSLETIYMIGQTVAAGAIVLSLAYAGFQVRQNTRLKRTELTSQSGIALHEFHRALAQSPETAALWRKGLIEEDILVGPEKTQFTLLMTAGFLGYEHIYLTHRDALLNPQFQDRAYRQMVFMFQNPGAGAWWRRNKLNLTTDFIDYVEREVLPTSELLRESQSFEEKAEALSGLHPTPSND